MKKYHAVLGAPDPEMEMTENILRLLNIKYVFATTNGERCDAGNAYQADAVFVPSGSRLIVVECEPINFRDFDDAVRIDHHRPGIDPAASMGPSQYLEASSIGQLCTLLKLNITNEVRIIAASDHCFASAVQRLCSDVLPDDVIAFRINEISGKYKIPKERISYLYSKFLKIIKSAKTKMVGQQEVVDLRRFCFNQGYTSELLILQMVLATEGQAALICLSHYIGGPQRVVITGYAYPETVLAFMVWAKEKGYRDIFGVPKRNYAGALYNDSNL